jgi:hypothetical protein
MNLLKLILDNEAKVNIGSISNGNLQITVVNQGHIEQHQVTETYIKAVSPENHYRLIEDMINKNKNK